MAHVGEGDTQGGSTITQQYVKNVYLNQNRSVSRKFTEAMIALKLDNQMSKDKILEGYLNTSWFGRGTYGIQRAAQAYYGKDVSRLNASEAAFLASLLKGAGLYDPALGKANHQRAVERWSWILDRMVDDRQAVAAERAKYTKFPEPLKSAGVYDTGKQSDYLVELAHASTPRRPGTSRTSEFDLGGYQIYTTFDRKRETALTDAVTKARKQGDEGRPGQRRRPSTTVPPRRHRRPDPRRLRRTRPPQAGLQRVQRQHRPRRFGVPAVRLRRRSGTRRPQDRGGPRPPRSRPQPLYDGNDGVPVTTPGGPLLGPQRQEGRRPQRRQQGLRADHACARRSPRP